MCSARLGRGFIVYRRPRVINKKAAKSTGPGVRLTNHSCSTNVPGVELSTDKCCQGLGIYRSFSMAMAVGGGGGAGTDRQDI